MLPPCYSHVAAVLEGPVGQLDPNVVVAFFIYRSDTSEIDIELARWGQTDGKNGQFVVAPPIPESRRHRFHIGPDTTRLPVAIEWTPAFVGFRAELTRALRWRHRGHSPTPDGHRLHISLWLHRGRAPAQEVQISISQVRITSSC